MEEGEKDQEIEMLRQEIQRLRKEVVRSKSQTFSATSPMPTATMSKKIIRRRNLGIKTQVKWNRNGQPIEEEAHLLIGFIGVVARKNIPITTKDWRYVTQQTLDAVWLEILVSLEATHL